MLPRPGALDGGFEAAYGDSYFCHCDLAGVAIYAFGWGECAAGAAGWVSGAGGGGLGAGALAGTAWGYFCGGGAGDFCSKALPVLAVETLAVEPDEAAAASGPGNDWKPFTADAVATYQAQGKPVFVDFTAKWCLSCQVNERLVLDRAAVQKRLKASGVVLLRADWTAHSAVITEALAKLGRSEIPTYALYPGAVGAAPALLPEVLTPGSVYEALEGLSKAGTAGAR